MREGGQGGRPTFLWIIGFLASCGGLDMQMHYANMRGDLVSGDYKSATDYLAEQESKFYAENSRLLYYMDRGMVAHQAGDYELSNTYLDQASDTAQELWTDSLGANAASWLTTDNSLPYQGEDFEKVAINMISALNYVGLGDYESARVEARQITNQLERYRRNYEADDSADGAQRYRDDAFARWLSAKMRALEGTFEGHNEAWIEYRAALKIYSTDYAERYGMTLPRFVIEDAMVSLAALGAAFRDEYEALVSRYPDVVPPSRDGRAEVVLIHLNGEAPYKVDNYWDTTAAGELLRIAYPEFLAKPHHIVGASLRAGVVESRSELGEPWTSIAIENLNDHMARIKTKAIARAVAKYIGAKGLQAAGVKAARDDEGEGVGLALLLVGTALQVGNYVIEEADKRSWITLPAQIDVARIWVEPGATQVDVTFEGALGQKLEEARFEFEAKSDATHFLIHRTYQ